MGLAGNLVRTMATDLRRASEDTEEITTPEQLREWLLEHLGVEFPTKACCPEHTAPWDAFCEAYFATAPIAVWKGSRGFAGKSFMLATLSLTEAATKGAAVMVLGGSAEQSENVVRYTDAMVDSPLFPTHLLEAREVRGHRQRRQSGLTKSRITLSNGGKLLASAASTRAARGPHDPRLRIDEADELNLVVLDAALGQTMAKPGVPAQTVISSTHHYPDGTMTEVLARAKEKSWPVREWCWRCTLARPDNPGGWLDPAEVQRKKSEVTAVMWDTEYDLQEPAPESRAFMPSSVEAMFDPALGVYRGAPGEYIEIEAPVDGGRYCTGADWAKERDWTVIYTLRYDVRPARLVAYERTGRKPWPVMVKRFDSRVRRFPGRAYYDATGLGNVVKDLIEVQAKPVILVGRARADMLNQYIVAVEGGGEDEDDAIREPQIVAPRIAHAYGEHKFASNDDLFGDGHLPDSICAGALAWIGASPKRTMRGKLTA